MSLRAKILLILSVIVVLYAVLYAAVQHYLIYSSFVALERNEARKDLEFLESNFREQTTKNVLPPDERPMSKFNGNAFRLDGGNGGRREYSGDIYLLPYWLGCYLDIIQ